MKTYRVGIRKVDITPPVEIRRRAHAARFDPVPRICNPLQAVSIAVDDGVTPFILVGADIIGFYSKADRVRSEISSATGIPESQIVLAGSHTHCGARFVTFNDEEITTLEKDYINRTISDIAAAAKAAWTTRETAVLTFGTGRCDMAVCRRKPDETGKVLPTMLPYREGISDHEVPVLTIESPEGRLRGLVYSYACHPTSRAGVAIGDDYVGFSRKCIEANLPGAIACFVQGCGADQKPKPVAPDAEVFGIRKEEEVRELGISMANAVTEVIRSGVTKPIAGAITLTRDSLQLRTEPSDVEELKQTVADPNPLRPITIPPAEYLLKRIEDGDPVEPVVPFEVQTLRFGASLAIVAMAGEMTVEHGLRLKRELRPHFDNVLVMGYANAVVGYIPVKRQIPEGGYCVEIANRIWRRTGPFVPETEGQIHRAIHQALGVDPPSAGTKHD